MKLSIVCPVYHAETIVPELVARIKNAIIPVTADYEIILVEDGSKDGSWNAICPECERDDKIKGIKLSRNFGQHYAITAGLDQVTGDWIVVMDCDLQDQPEEISKLYTKAQEGFDIVLAQRHNRQDPLFKRIASMIFYRSLAWLTGSEQDESIANFGIYHKKVIREIVHLRESIRYFPTMVKWVGFNATKIKVDHAPRVQGKTNYNISKMLNLASDIILAYSDKPIRLTIIAGLIIAATSVLIAVVTLFRWWNGDIIVSGYTSLIISIWFLSGCILTTLGVVGLYVGKTFEGVKKRPLYIIEKILNDKGK